MNDAEHLLKYFTIDFYAYGVEVGVADFLVIQVCYIWDIFLIFLVNRTLVEDMFTMF